MKKEPNFTNNYEDLVKREYGELEEEKLGEWGTMEYKGKLVGDNNPEYIKDIFTERILKDFQIREVGMDKESIIIDFGGSEGKVLDTVSAQLKEKGYTGIKGVNLEFIEERLQIMKDKYSSELSGVRGTLEKLPFKNNSVDIGIMRRVLQYFNKEEQKKILENVYKCLKPGGKIIIHGPGAATNEEIDDVNNFSAEVIGTITNHSPQEILKRKHLPSCDEMKKVAEEIGFAIKEMEIPSQEILSTESWASRFKISEDQLNKLNEIHRQGKEKYPHLKFTESENKIYVIWNHPLYVLEKPLNQ